MSHLLQIFTLKQRGRAYRIAERTVTSKLAAQGVPYLGETAVKMAGKNPKSDIACKLCAVAATFASTEQKEARTLLALIQVASQLPASCGA
jgi:hypothetical protein